MNKSSRTTARERVISDIVNFSVIMHHLGEVFLKMSDAIPSAEPEQIILGLADSIDMIESNEVLAKSARAALREILRLDKDKMASALCAFSSLVFGFSEEFFNKE